MAKFSRVVFLFPSWFRDALLAGQPVEFEVGGESGVFRIDRTHGKCVCKFVEEEETPLFDAKYLESKVWTSKN